MMRRVKRSSKRSSRRSLKSRIAAPFYLTLAAFILLLVCSGITLGVRYSGLREQMVDAVSVNQKVNHVMRLSGVARERIFEYRVSRSRSEIAKLIALNNERWNIISELKRLPSGNPDRARFMRGFFGAYERSLAHQLTVVRAIDSNADDDEIRRAYRSWRATEILTAARLADLVGYMGKDLQTNEKRMNEFLMALGSVVAGFVAFGALAVWFVAKYYDRTVIHPLSALSASLDQVAKGNLEAQVVPPTVRDEIWRMSVDFNRMTSALRESHSDLKAFVSMAAHDIRSPLATIKGFAELGREDLDEGDIDNAKESLDRIGAIANRSLEMVDQLLKLERAGSVPLETRRIELGDVLREALDDLDSEVRTVGAIVDTKPLPVVRGDHLQFRTLFQNLISNALKYKREGTVPRVSIASRDHGDGTVEIHFTDNGRGFDIDQAEKIFEPFARLASSQGTQGYGVGLSTCRKIVQRHGGTITATGRPNEGATFSIRLPAPEIDRIAPHARDAQCGSSSPTSH